MRILYINGWPIGEPLTTSSSFPSLKTLAKSGKVEVVHFVTPEQSDVLPQKIYDGVVHIPITLPRIESYWHYFAFELRHFERLLCMCRRHNYDLILARGATAGGRAYRIHQRTNIPFYVESFEPHSAYMLESGVWTWYDPRFLVQRFRENRMKRKASALITVSPKYARHLVESGVPNENVFTIPCTVDLEKNAFNTLARTHKRRELNIPPGATVGIYVGKFGGLYYGLDDALSVFDDAFKTFDDFHLIVLSNIDSTILYRHIETGRVHLLSVPPDEVSSYLSAADFAYALIKESPSKSYCSPVKTGEYWANGLPVVITRGIGEDSGIIDKSKLGVVLSRSSADYPAHAGRIRDIISDAGHRSAVFELANKFRNRSLICDVYRDLGLA